MTIDTGADRFRRGEAVPLKLIASDLQDHAITLPFRTTQRYDFQVLQNGRLLWNWAYHKRFTRSVEPLIVGPGEKVTFSEAWDQLGNDGKPVPPGTYTVRAFIAAAADRKPLTMEKRLEIVP